MHASPGPIPQSIRRAEDELARFCLALPSTVEENPWGHRAMKVNRKVFVFLGSDAQHLGLSMKLPQSSVSALDKPFCEPTGYGLGKSGWVSASFGPDERIPLELLKSWILESFRAIAPKRVVAAMDGAPAKPKAKSPRKRA